MSVDTKYKGQYEDVFDDEGKNLYVESAIGDLQSIYKKSAMDGIPIATTFMNENNSASIHKPWLNMTQRN